MANKTLNTRIKLKYDTLANWQGAGADVVLLKGEIGICEIPTGSTAEQVTPPAILFKVGDGTKTFSELPWVSALAADVYAWAKAANKPTYTATEVGAAPTNHTHLHTAITDFDTAVDTRVNNLIATLDSEAEVQSGKFITGFELVDGKVTNIQYGEPAEIAVPEYTLEAGTDGSLTLKKDGAAVSENIKVTGWDDLVSDIAAKYTKPTGGIPKTDLASAVQTSLGKADTALQADALDGYATTSSVTSAINTHNTSSTAHQDIRNLISTLSSQIGDLGNALHFIGVETELPESGEAGDVVIVGTKEYVWANDTWNEFGSGDHITKAQADGYYDAKGTAQNLINGLDATISGLGVGKTITALTQTNGTISATVSDIAITRSQVTDLQKYGTVSTLSIGDVANLQDTLDDKLESTDIAGLATTSTVNALTSRVTTLEGKPGLDKVGTVTSVAVAGEADKITVSGSPITSSGTITVKLGSKVLTTDDTLIFDCGSATTLVD